MALTNKHGLPYPLATADARMGASDIEALAKELDKRLGGALFRASVDNEPVADATDDTLDINLTVDDSAVFSDQGNLIKYVGDTTVVATVSAQVVWAGSGAGSRRVAILRNGNEEVWIKDTPDGAENYAQAVSWPVKLAPNDTLGLRVRQTSGGALNVVNGKLRCVVLGIQPA